jgi:serine/threonine protein kinase
LENYNLLKTLGQGAFSKVKLAFNVEDNKHYAVKIHREGSGMKSNTIDIVENEARAMQKLSHPGIINIVNYIPKATVTKPNGSTYNVVCVIVEELALGGELFFYVKNSGFFEENVARYFFNQMIEALAYVHNAGQAHRDIKPDNILFD